MCLLVDQRREGGFSQRWGSEDNSSIWGDWTSRVSPSNRGRILRTERSACKRMIRQEESEYFIRGNRPEDYREPDSSLIHGRISTLPETAERDALSRRRSLMMQTLNLSSSLWLNFIDMQIECDRESFPSNSTVFFFLQSSLSNCLCSWFSQLINQSLYQSLPFVGREERTTTPRQNKSASSSEGDETSKRCRKQRDTDILMKEDLPVSGNGCLSLFVSSALRSCTWVCFALFDDLNFGFSGTVTSQQQTDLRERTYRIQSSTCLLSQILLLVEEKCKRQDCKTSTRYSVSFFGSSFHSPTKRQRTLQEQRRSSILEKKTERRFFQEHQ